MLITTMSFAQTIENVTFSAVASSNDNFQPVMGTPYGASLSGANGSLEISASLEKVLMSKVRFLLKNSSCKVASEYFRILLPIW